MKKWKRANLQNAPFRTLPQLIIDKGGFGFPDIVEGCVAAASRCALMGEPWCHRHPQTDLMEYAVIDFSWSDQFEECWAEYM